MKEQQVEEWTSDQCAAEWSVKVRTWHGYVAKGKAPKPIRHVNRTPVWSADQVRDWERPGQGARTDIVKDREK